MKYKVEKAIEVLGQTPKVLETLLAGLSEEWTHSNEGPDTWSPFEVVGHLIINEETNFLSRAQLILSSREPEVLTRISMTAHVERFSNLSLEAQLQLFRDLRTQNINTLHNLSITDEDLEKTAIHPEVGTVRLANVLSTWVTHDLIHIGQIARVMAKQYKDEVGPFIQYLKRLQ